MEETGKSIKNGFFAGLLGSLCCVTPLVLVLIGLSGVSGAMALAGVLQQKFRWTIFIPIASIFLIASIYYHIKRREGVCNARTIKNYKAYIFATVFFAVLVWVSLIYIIVPAIFSLLS